MIIECVRNKLYALCCFFFYFVLIFSFQKRISVSFFLSHTISLSSQSHIIYIKGAKKKKEDKAIRLVLRTAYAVISLVCSGV